jgi:hypothetical protein
MPSLLMPQIRARNNPTAARMPQSGGLFDDYQFHHHRSLADASKLQ